MNKVALKTESKVKTTLKDVVASGHIAFVGECGCGPADSLYLIVGDVIVQADHPVQRWSVPSCTVIVDCYVDVEIKEI